MRHATIALFALAASTAQAQVTLGSNPTALGPVSQSLGVANDGQILRDTTQFSRDERVFTLRRAGAWGRCVTDAAPTDASAFARTPGGVAHRRLAFRLAPVFTTCARQVGGFDPHAYPGLQQQAIRYALGATSKS